MSQEFLDFHNAALSEGTALFGSTFIYNNKSYNAVIDPVEITTELEDGGFMEVLGTRIIVSRSQFSNTPVSGETLFIGAKKVRILKVIEDEIAFELQCVTASK